MICPHFHNNASDNPCPFCKEDIAVLDLTELRPNQYNQMGQVITGDLKELGWGIFRSACVSYTAETKITEICNTAKKWIPIERHRVMKYDASSSFRPVAWEHSSLVQMSKDLKQFILNKALPSVYYNIDKFNVLKNTGIIEEDQEPHFDYRPQ